METLNIYEKYDKGSNVNSKCENYDEHCKQRERKHKNQKDMLETKTTATL